MRMTGNSLAPDNEVLSPSAKLLVIKNTKTSKGSYLAKSAKFSTSSLYLLDTKGSLKNPLLLQRRGVSHLKPRCNRVIHEPVIYYMENLPADTHTGTWSKSKLKVVILSKFFLYLCSPEIPKPTL